MLPPTAPEGASALRHPPTPRGTVVHGILADVVMLLHFGFVLFVALGALLLLRWPRAAWIHLPCVLYGAAIEFFGWVCPLTPLEIQLRRRAGAAGYEGGFIQNYLEGVLYPAGWADVHVWLGVAVLLGNGLLYAWVWRRLTEGGAA